MTTQPDSVAHFDGNALAGPLADVFATDVTTAVARCRGCGLPSPIATLVVYGPDPGQVARCPGCFDVLLRLVRTPTSIWLDLSGMTAIRVTLD